MSFQQTFNARVIPAADRAFGVEVTLMRGGRTSEAFTAVWELIENEVVTDENLLSKVVSRVFMFAVDGPTIDSETVEPRKGDRLSVTEADGSVVVFELLPEANLPAVELMAGGYRWRVRAKKVG